MIMVSSTISIFHERSRAISNFFVPALLSLLLVTVGSAQETFSPSGDPCDLISGRSRATDKGIYYAIDESQLHRIRNCTTFYQSIHLSSSSPSEDRSWGGNTTGNDITILDFGEITHIKGSLVLPPKESSLRTIRARNLKQIDGSFDVRQMSSLEQIDMPALIRVGQDHFYEGQSTFTLSRLPKLRRVQMGPGEVMVSFPINASVSRIVQVSGTGLRKIDFLRSEDLPTVNLDGLLIHDNPELSEINLPELRGALGEVRIYDNNPNLTITMAKLQSGRDFKINNVKVLNLPELQEIANDFVLTNNTFETINFERLGVVGDTLNISNNAFLTEVRLNSLKYLGSTYSREAEWPSNGKVQITANPKLSLLLLDALEKVGRSIRISGMFDSLSYNIADAIFRSPYSPVELHLNSSNPTFDCTNFDRRVAQLWKGTSFPSGLVYTCVTLDTQGRDISPLNPSFKAYMSSSTKGIIAGAVCGTLLVVAFIGWCIWAQRKQRKLQVARIRAREEGRGDIELHDVSTAAAYNGHARRREIGEQPPRYTRTGKPGEIPPTYIQDVGRDKELPQVPVASEAMTEVSSTIQGRGDVITR